MNITILGNGSWGTALALTLQRQNKVTLWGPLPDEIDALRRDKENKKFLPGYSLENIIITPDIKKVLHRAEAVVIAIPTKYLRKQLQLHAANIPPAVPVVSATKGLEDKTFKLVSGIIAEFHPADNILALSGPSHAEEVAARIPTAITLAGSDSLQCRQIQQAFMTPFFRVYTNYDMTGVQIGGALKNIIAIAAGMCKGLEYGSNTIAALMTRGIKEISRFGVFMGAEEKTFHGLSGIGDLITTCISDFSRNFFVGREMARGRSIRQVTEKMVMVAEGVETTRSVYHFAEQKQLDMPIAKAVYKVLFDALPPQQAVEELMTREAKSEN